MRTLNGESGFKVTRALPAMDTFVTGIDKTVKKHLDELNKLLGKRIFRAVGRADGHGEGKAEGKAGAGITVSNVLSKELTAKRVPPGTDPWANDTVMRILFDASEAPLHITLAEHIDTTPDLVELKYAFQKYRLSLWIKLDYNTRAVLEGYSNIEDYLIAYAFHVMNVTDVNALCSFVVSNIRGVKRIVHYSVVSASRSLIDEQQLNVKNYNDDNGSLANALRSSKISLSAVAFLTEAMAKIKTFVFDSDEMELINSSKFGTVPDSVKSMLVKYIQKSPYPITKTNIDYHMPVWLAEVYPAQGYSSQQQLEPILDDQDFTVQFQDDPSSNVSDISRSAVRCAALL